jgi:HD superfamily phosphodiesterase
MYSNVLEESIHALIINKAILKLNELLATANVDSGHGIDHALTVMSLAKRAIHYHNPSDFDSNKLLAIQLAALLHDADDSKFFDQDTSDNMLNTKAILKHSFKNYPIYSEDEQLINLIYKMIEITSFSKYGNAICDNYSTSLDDNKYFDEDEDDDELKVFPEWMLYPRLADRLEAIGSIGIKRCFIYSDFKKRLRYNDDDLTNRPNTVEDILKAKDPDRMYNYLRGIKSTTAISHFYDKILFVGDFEPQTNNTWLINEANERMKVIYDFLINGDWNISPINIIIRD